jgi:hypothetical protein
VECEIEAAALGEAMDKFPEAIRAAVNRMVEEAQAYQRAAASRIVTPDEALGGPGAGGGNLILK